MEDKPRIAVVIPGGIDRNDNVPALVDLLRRLAGSFELSIYSFAHATLHPSLENLSCTFSFPPPATKSRILKAVYLLWLIRRDHTARHFAAIHGFWVMRQGLVAVLAGKILHIPSLVSLPGGDIVHLPSIRYGSMSNPIKRFLVRWCIRSADRVIVLTQFQRHILETDRFSYRNLSVIPFGADISQFVYRPHPPLAHPRVLFIGNLNRVKDPFTLIQTFFHLTQQFDCRLTIVGAGALSTEVLQYARGYGVIDKIQFKGHIPHERIPEEIYSSDILLLTSLYEGEGVVVMEAYACGILVAGTRVGILDDIGDDTVTVTPGDAEGLAAKIENLFRQTRLLQEAQQKNRLYAEQHSAEWTCLQYKQLYDELLTARQP